MRAWEAAKTTLLIFTKCPRVSGTSLGSGDMAVDEIMRPAFVELTFRVRWDKKRQIKYLDGIVNGKSYGKK